MISAWTCTAHGLTPHTVTGNKIPPGAVWLDVVDVTREEEDLIEARFGIEVPNREEMQAIEVSNRLYREGPAAYMSAIALINTDTDLPGTTPVTFVFMRDCLVTLRYAEPWAFKAFAQRAIKPVNGCTNAETAFLGLMEATIERLGDLVQRIAGQLDACSLRAFHQGAGEVDLQQVLQGIGRTGYFIGKLRESLADKDRLIGFADKACQEWFSPDGHDRVHVLLRDVHALITEVEFLGTKASFLLDAAVGMISIDQNRILKIFSIASVVLLPPAVVAGMFGMNYELPLKDARWGFLVAVVLMVASMIIPLWWFRRNRWL